MYHSSWVCNYSMGETKQSLTKSDAEQKKTKFDEPEKVLFLRISSHVFLNCQMYKGSFCPKRSETWWNELASGTAGKHSNVVDAKQFSGFL